MSILRLEKDNSFFKESPCPMWIIDQQTLQFLDVNQAAINQYGYSHEEFLIMALPDVRVEGAMVGKQYLKELIRSNQNAGFMDIGNSYHQHKNGTRFYVHVYSHNILYNEKSAGLAFLVNDNERVQAQMELNKKKDEIEHILNSIRDGFFALDKNWNFTYVNKEFERIYACKGEDIIGMNYWQRFPNAKTQKFYTEYNRAVNKQTVVSFEEYASSLSKWVSLKVYPTPEGIAVYFTDITEEKKLLEKTLEDEKTLIAQNKQLMDIAWIQSHKVRAPLARILGLIPLLNYDQPADKDNKVILEGIEEAGHELDAVIREITDKTHPS